jgi:hypothetical protein
VDRPDEQAADTTAVEDQGQQYPEELPSEARPSLAVEELDADLRGRVCEDLPAPICYARVRSHGPSQ